MKRHANIRYEARLTGNTRRLTGDGPPLDLPEVELVRQFEVDDFDEFDAVTLLDGEAYYLVDTPWYNDPEPGCQARYLSQTACNFLCAGKDVYEYETRTAPEALAGICAWPKGSLCGYGDPLFAVVPPELERVRREREERAERRRIAEQANSEYERAVAIWREAWNAMEAAKAATGRFYDLPERQAVANTAAVMHRLEREAKEAASRAGLLFTADRSPL